MLDEVFNNLAQNVGPQIFNAVGFERVQILRHTRTANDYGGEDEGTVTEGEEIPATIKYTTTNRMSVTGAAGQEYSDARIEMPLYWQGELVSVQTDDRVRVLERGEIPERLFQVKRASPTPMHLILEVVTA